MEELVNRFHQSIFCKAGQFSSIKVMWWLTTFGRHIPFSSSLSVVVENIILGSLSSLLTTDNYPNVVSSSHASGTSYMSSTWWNEPKINRELEFSPSLMPPVSLDVIVLQQLAAIRSAWQVCKTCAIPKFRSCSKPIWCNLNEGTSRVWPLRISQWSLQITWNILLSISTFAEHCNMGHSTSVPRFQEKQS